MSLVITDLDERIAELKQLEAAAQVECDVMDGEPLLVKRYILAHSERLKAEAERSKALATKAP